MKDTLARFNHCRNMKAKAGRLPRSLLPG